MPSCLELTSEWQIYRVPIYATLISATRYSLRQTPRAPDSTAPILGGSVLNKTVLAGVDLTQVCGLETCRHDGPSAVDHSTLVRSYALPLIFLRGCGVAEELIGFLVKATAAGRAYYSCFISYSSVDQSFAERLYADLQARGVRCWFAPEDLKIGDDYPTRISNSIKEYDKLLLVLSAHSISSRWVEDEVRAAIERENQQPGNAVLFPVRVDGEVLNTEKSWPHHSAALAI